MTNDQIIEQLGLSSADEAEREVIINQVYSIVELRIVNLMVELLTDEQLAEFNQLRESGTSTDEIWKWLDDQLETTTVAELRQAILADYIREHTTK